MALLTTQSKKTLKGSKFGYTTYISYMSPFTQNNKGINLCPNASEGCAVACLYQSGNARFSQIQVGRINRSNSFLADRQKYLLELVHEIRKAVVRHEKMINDVSYNNKGKVLRYKKFAVRLNGTSDISFEKFKIVDGKTIFELFPNVQFYDYTKNIKKLERVKAMGLTNYHLTFSRSETNDKEVDKAIEMGYNVAVVFDKLPKTYKGLEVVDGDETDLRFLDKQNVIVGLTYKRASVKGGTEINRQAKASGFVVETAI